VVVIEIVYKRFENRNSFLPIGDVRIKLLQLILSGILFPGNASNLLSTITQQNSSQEGQKEIHPGEKYNNSKDQNLQIWLHLS